MKPYFYDVNELLTKNEEGKTIINKEKLEDLFDKIYLEGYFCGLEEYPCKDCDNKKLNDYSSKHFSHPKEDYKALQSALEESDWDKTIDDSKDIIKDENNMVYDKKLFFDKLNSDGYISSSDFNNCALFTDETKKVQDVANKRLKSKDKKENIFKTDINFKGNTIPESFTKANKDILDEISKYIEKILSDDEKQQYSLLENDLFEKLENIEYEDLQPISLEELKKCIKLDEERKYKKPEKEDVIHDSILNYILKRYFDI